MIEDDEDSFSGSEGGSGGKGEIDAGGEMDACEIEGDGVAGVHEFNEFVLGVGIGRVIHDFADGEKELREAGDVGGFEGVDDQTVGIPEGEGFGEV